MKRSLAWFSPVAPQRTEVSGYTARLLPYLRRDFSVTSYTETRSGIFCVETGQWFHSDRGTVPGELLREVNRADLPVYHIGNNHDFHMNTWILSRLKPGLVVLHDRTLHRLVHDVYKRRVGDRAAYLHYMRELYGGLGLEAAKVSWEGKLSIEFMADRFPLTELAVENALGVIVHTAESLLAVQAITDQPVFRLPLPYPSQPAHGCQRAATEFSSEHPAAIIILGCLGPNRHVGEFLAALAGLHDRDCYRVEIVGAISHTLDLLKRIAEHGLQANVQLRGEVEEAQLDHYLANADLAINLRDGSAGEACGSQLRIWDHALPSLVTGTDAVAELTENIVCFVRPEHETADFQTHLRAFLKNPQLFREQGARGKKLLERTHHPEQYVTKLRNISSLLRPLRTRRISIDLANTVGALRARTFGGAPSLDGSQRTWAECIHELFKSGSVEP